MHHIGKFIARIHEAQQKWLTGELSSAGLKGLVPSHGDVFAYLFEHNTATMAELADFAHRTCPTMTVLVDKLEALGLVRRRKSKDDTRKQIVSLTKEGASLRPVFEDISTRFISRLYDGVSDSEAAEVERILAKVLSNTEKGKTP